MRNKDRKRKETVKNETTVGFHAASRERKYTSLQGSVDTY